MYPNPSYFFYLFVLCRILKTCGENKKNCKKD